jgi:hypothetical protein
MATDTSADGLKTYYGNCHCGAYKFRVLVPEITSVYDCDCSICFKKGYKYIMPEAGRYIVDKGEGALKEYKFAAGTLSHHHCPTCGTGVIAIQNPTGKVFVNVCVPVKSRLGEAN